MTQETADGVTVHVASLNTATATELCIRSMRELAGRPFELVVGDCGSTDGSLEMLERFAAAGWLRLEIAPEGRIHSDWLDRWLRECTSRYAVFTDSDVEYLEPGWLDDMVDAASESGAALVCGRMQRPNEHFVHPITGATRPVAARPTAWLLMLDTHQVRGRIDASFAYREELNPAVPGGKLAYDTVGWYFKKLREADLTWIEMPIEWQRKYRHFGGLTWLGPLRRGASLRLQAKQIAKLVIVRSHLLRARRNRWGETLPVRPAA